MRFWAWVLALLYVTAIAGRVHAEVSCAPALDGRDRAFAFDAPLSEPQRQGLSKAISRTLRHDATWPDGEIAASAPCVVGQVIAGGTAYDIHAGSGETPLRWLRADAMALTIFLIPEERRPDDDLKPYYLMAKTAAGMFLVQLYTGLPREAEFRRDAKAALEGDVSPVAIYDRTGDAVTLFRATQSELTGYLIGPTPTPAAPATFSGADGAYFEHTTDRSVRMAGSHLPCPAVLGELKLRTLTVTNGDKRALDLRCAYDAGDVELLVEVRPAANSTAQSWFDVLMADARTTFPKMTLASSDVPTGEKNPLSLGQSWILDGEARGAGVWTGQIGGYLIDVRGQWPADSARTITNALVAWETAVRSDD